MHTPEQYDEQIKLERDQIAQGLKRLRDNTNVVDKKSLYVKIFPLLGSLGCLLLILYYHLWLIVLRKLHMIG